MTRVSLPMLPARREAAAGAEERVTLTEEDPAQLTPHRTKEKHLPIRPQPKRRLAVGKPLNVRDAPEDAGVEEKDIRRPDPYPRALLIRVLSEGGADRFHGRLRVTEEHGRVLCKKERILDARVTGSH